jgi:DNA-binding LacI/PurR family transcriptional regulator
MATRIPRPAERPTLDTVARAAGVSRMTVSNAYNRPDQLSAATRDRVLDAARALGYAGPHPTAASLRLGRTDTVGVVLTERLPEAFVDPGLVMILHGIATELSRAGNALLLVPAYGADGEALLRHALVDALILCSLAPDDPAVAAALDRRVPLVTVGYPRLPRVPFVGPDTGAAAGLVAEHLLALGHRRIAVLTTVSGEARGPSRPIFGDRVDGFRRVVRAAGRSTGEIEIVTAPDNARAAGRDAIAPLLRSAEPPTAVFAVTDILALGALDAAHAAGRAVPGELSVAGYDGIAAGETSDPPLTTITQDLFGQGRAAARLARRRTTATSPVATATRSPMRPWATGLTAGPNQPRAIASSRSSTATRSPSRSCHRARTAACSPGAV